MGKIKLLKYKPVHYMVMVCPNESIEDISFRESSESKQVYINSCRIYNLCYGALYKSTYGVRQVSHCGKPHTNLQGGKPPLNPHTSLLRSHLSPLHCLDAYFYV